MNLFEKARALITGEGGRSGPSREGPSGAIARGHTLAEWSGHRSGSRSTLGGLFPKTRALRSAVRAVAPFGRTG
jgi:hypothetical protein